MLAKRKKFPSVLYNSGELSRSIYVPMKMSNFRGMTAIGLNFEQYFSKRLRLVNSYCNIHIFNQFSVINIFDTISSAKNV